MNSLAQLTSLCEIKMDPLKVEHNYSNIQEKKQVHFFNLLEITYDADVTALDFYYQYRNLVIASLKKKGDIIVWQNNLFLTSDEQLSPTFEELILAQVLGLINPLLPALVRDTYVHAMGKTRGLMDFRTDILVRVPVFLREIENTLYGISTEHPEG